jgi:hypothetical protein
MKSIASRSGSTPAFRGLEILIEKNQRIGVRSKPSGSFAALRMTAKTCNSNCNSEGNGDSEHYSSQIRDAKAETWRPGVEEKIASSKDDYY